MQNRLVESGLQSHPHRVPGAKCLSWSFTKQLAAVVTKALGAFGPEGRAMGSGRSNLVRWEPYVSICTMRTHSRICAASSLSGCSRP